MLYHWSDFGLDSDVHLEQDSGAQPTPTGNVAFAYVSCQSSKLTNGLNIWEMLA